MIKLNKIISYFLIIFISVSCVNALNETTQKNADVEVEIIFSDVINSSEEYSEFLLIRNNDDTIGVDDSLYINVSYNLTFNNSLILNFSTIKKINYYTKSGMGLINISENGTYYFCAYIYGLNYNDTNLENNYECKEIIVVGENYTYNSATNHTTYNVSTNNTNNNSLNISENNETNIIDDCNFSINIKIKNKLLELGEKQEFTILADNISKTKYNHIVEYWVEDLFENIIKNKINTTSTSVKSFTPSFEEEEKTFLIKAKVHECNLETYELFSVKSNNEQEEKETELKIIYPQKVNYEDIFLVELEGFKANTRKTLISIWVEDENKKISEITKVYVLQKYKKFHFKVPVVFKETKIENKEYLLIIDGLNIRKEELIEIEYSKETETIENNDENKIISNNDIESFYTRKKNFEPEITIYATTKNFETNLFLHIYSSISSKNISVNNKTVEAKINISCPNEILIAELWKNNDLIDTKILKINLKHSENTQCTEIDTVTKSNIEQLIEKNDLSKNLTTNQITGNVLLSDSQKPDYSTFIFFVGAIIASTLIFRNDLIKLITKKTNLFK